MTIETASRPARDLWRSLSTRYLVPGSRAVRAAATRQFHDLSARLRRAEPRAALETATERLRTAAADFIEADPRVQVNQAKTLWRTISTNLMDAEPRAVLFVSSEGNEGEAEAALSACREAGREGFKVCLVVADLEAGGDGVAPPADGDPGATISLLGHVLRIEKGGPGQPDILRLRLEGELLRDIVSRAPSSQTTAIDDLRHQLLARLNRTYKFIVIIGGSVLVDPYSLIFADRVPGIVLVVRAGHARLQEVGRSVSLIEASGGSILGSVMTDRRTYLPDWIERRL